MTIETIVKMYKIIHANLVLLCINFWAIKSLCIPFNLLFRCVLDGQDAVTVVGYPLGGDTISVTKGVVSRIEVLLMVNQYWLSHIGTVMSLKRVNVPNMLTFLRFKIIAEAMFCTGYIICSWVI